MLVSTSPIPNNYVFDTNVVTRFARINRLDLLLHLSIGHVYITPAIQRELETGLNNGVKYCKHEGIKSIRLTNLVKKLQKAGLLAEDEIQIMFS